MSKSKVDPLALAFNVAAIGEDVRDDPRGISKAYTASIYFPSATARREFMKAVKRAIKARGKYTHDQIEIE